MPDRIFEINNQGRAFAHSRVLPGTSVLGPVSVPGCVARRRESNVLSSFEFRGRLTLGHAAGRHQPKHHGREGERNMRWTPIEGVDERLEHDPEKWVPVFGKIMLRQ
jgi:hypothetical protein